ncbi:unnamed protein product [Schistosoma curassoni]|uniref:Reverse transcriptase domain-containing protein n=1 Tax=Schistosoma curassoni TaxID=6186 RepID=A0A183K3B7_9TREM|nr:unnamed protein product [Schistosoma curassoni]
MKDCVDAQLRDQQGGFRKDRSCTDQIATLRIIVEQSIEWNSSLYINFIDYEKAFDSVDRTTLWKPRHYGVPKNTLRREMETDVRKMDKNWIELERKAQDRVGWRMLVGGLPSIRSNKRNCVISGTLSSCYSSKNSKYYIGVAIWPAMEKLDIHSTPETFEDYLERFEIWSMTKKDLKGDKIVAHFLTFIGREAYSLLKTLAYPEKPISLPYATFKELLLSHVKCTSFECRERVKFHNMVHQNDQKVREFILELQKQAAMCNFGDQLNVQLRDRLIAGKRAVKNAKLFLSRC